MDTSRINHSVDAMRYFGKAAMKVSEAFNRIVQEVDLAKAEILMANPNKVQNPMLDAGYAHRDSIDAVNWRTISDKEREVFLNWVLGSSTARSEYGKDEYGEDFQGDPLIHLAEELFDSLFYVYAALKQREALLNENEQLVNRARPKADDNPPHSINTYCIEERCIYFENVVFESHLHSYKLN